jgi:hypothetical protein
MAGEVAAMSGHWLITRPTLLAVSGGRTSMHMLWRYLDRHDGRLPHGSVAVFCNTGKEHPATLDFVQRCSTDCLRNRMRMHGLMA